MNKFNGFPRECFEFYRRLTENNTKIWFAENRGDYERYVLEPARDFVVAMGNLLHEIYPDIKAIPKIDKSIFRIFRDVRFSKDKTPYKTHLGIWFWEGEGPRMSCSGFYFHIEDNNFLLGSGIYMFPKDIMSAYRDAVVDERYGPELAAAIEKVKNNGPYGISGSHYKKIPRGYDKDHQYADLLLKNGLTAYIEEPIPDVLYTPDILDYCLQKYKDMAPVHEWLRALVERMKT